MTESMEQENARLRDELAAVRAESERARTETENLKAMVTALMAAQHQPTPPPLPGNTQEVTLAAVPLSTTIAGTSQLVRPAGYTLGMPTNFGEEGRPLVSEVSATIPFAVPISQPGNMISRAATQIPQLGNPFIQATIPVPQSGNMFTQAATQVLQSGNPFIQATIPVPQSGNLFTQAATQAPQPYNATTQAPQPYNATPQAVMTYSAPMVHTTPYNDDQLYHADDFGSNNQVVELKEAVNEMRQEMKAIRGKDVFSQQAQDLCLVPDVVVPYKFKVPKFEKYEGNSCPKAHVTMYVRKMSTQTKNDKLLIFFFHDSLTGAALDWYMNLERTGIHTFTDLANAFIQQYKYNSYLAPDRDELRAMTRRDKETFKEYAQRWRQVAAKIRPPPEERELTKIFLQTLDPFYYEKMIGVASHDFTDMVGMGMRIEEGIKAGRLFREGAPSNPAKKFDNNFTKKKEQGVGMVAHGRSQPVYQPQQQPRQQARPKQQQFDLIPMKYADLLPSLLERNLVQTKPPPRVPEILPAWYKAHLNCAYHQGAPGHDIEHCYGLRAEVQRLVRANLLTFEDTNPNR